MKEQRVPDRLRHVFEFYGIDAFDTLAREAMFFSSGFVYLIGCGRHVKIGTTNGDARARLAFLQIGNPKELKLLKVFRSEHPTYAEDRLHAMYAKHYTRGEWFELPRRDINVLLHVENIDEWLDAGEDEDEQTG